MKDYLKTLMLLVLIQLSTSGNASLLSQNTYDDLVSLKGNTVNIFVSRGHEELGGLLAALVTGANAYLSELVGMEAPSPEMFILSRNDWGKYTNPQIIYGMPHYGAAKLVVAAEDNDFWRANMPPLQALVPEQQDVFRKVYTNGAGKLSVKPFFDLLAIHELGHGWTVNHKIKRQRFWLEEVFCNLFLHTYIAEKQPELLPALEVLPMLQVTGNRDSFKYTTLSQFEEGYWIIGRDAPVNYGWYQFRFHYAAKQVYDNAGPDALKNLWMFLAAQSEVLDDETLVNALQYKVHPAMADVYREWNR